MTTALVATGTGVVGFATGVLYSVRRLPKWLAGLSDRQLAELVGKAERVRFGI